MKTETQLTGLEKAKIAADILKKGGTMREATNALGYRGTSSMRFLLQKHGFGNLLYDARSNKDRDGGWFRGKADPSGLTEEELARCKAVGITPERWAWLKLCPRDGNPTGSKYYKI